MQRAAYAFFDVDDTVLRTKSMFSFFEYWCEEWIKDPQLLSHFNSHFEKARSRRVSRERMNREYYRFLSGVDPDRLATAGEEWAKKIIGQDLFFAPTLSKMRNLADRGVDAVFVSGSFAAVLQPIARHLEVRHVLAARMQIGEDRLYSGEIGEPQTIGVGKAVAVNNFLSQNGSLSSECWAFGDDVSDVPMLEVVGHPIAVGSSPELSAIAGDRGWPILSLAS